MDFRKSRWNPPFKNLAANPRAAVLERSSVGGRAAGLYSVCRWFEPIRSNFSVIKKFLTSYIFYETFCRNTERFFSKNIDFLIRQTYNIYIIKAKWVKV